ncbi:putative bifunctional diguanylate cyclase/phosphodiesterase, partial [Pseudomonadota bacterium]
ALFPAWLTITAIRNNSDELVNYVAVFSDISAIKQSQERLDHLAYHDHLTNLPNRLLFNDRLKHAIQRANRDDYEVAVLFIDLDRFKYINDTLGHPIGDQLIQQAASRLRNSVRKEDTVARIGGDEFVIAMEHPKESQGIVVLAQKIVNAFHTPIMINSHALHVTVSMGISIFPQDGKDVDTLIKNADIALYQVKDQGRNNFRFYTQEMTTAVFERLTLENSLRHALKNNEMCLHYQPQYCLKTNQILGCEALIRWSRPDKGMIYPAKLIPVAEESGLIIELGEWVLRTACQQMRAWLDTGKKIQRVAVNVSALQLKRDTFIKELKTILEETNLPAHYLELELTETVIMHDAKWSVALLEQLKTLGVTLSIDDFGTGYSSLGYLKRFPISKLKIDRSFVSDIPTDSNDTAITQAIIAMTKSLQLDVIAEGIESEEQREFLIANGCYQGQGFLLGKPQDADEFCKNYL